MFCFKAQFAFLLSTDDSVQAQTSTLWKSVRIVLNKGSMKMKTFGYMICERWMFSQLSTSDLSWAKLNGWVIFMDQGLWLLSLVKLVLEPQWLSFIAAVLASAGQHCFKLDALWGVWLLCGCAKLASSHRWQHSPLSCQFFIFLDCSVPLLRRREKSL